MDVSLHSALDLENRSRRRFLRKTLLGVVALGVSKYFLPTSFLNATAVSSSTTIGFLSPAQMATLQALSNRLIPSGEAMPAAAELNVAGGLDQFLMIIDPPVAEQIAQLLDLFDFSPMIFDFKWGRFTSLPPADQDDVLSSWATSRLEFRRTGFVALKKLSMAVYYSQDAVWKTIGYDGPLV